MDHRRAASRSRSLVDDRRRGPSLHRARDGPPPAVERRRSPRDRTRPDAGLCCGAVARSAFVRALDVDQRGLADARPANALPSGWLFRRTISRKAHGPALLRGRVQRFDDAYVLQPFLAGRLRLAVAENAVGEVQQLRRELIALADALSRRLPSDRQVVPEPFGVEVPGIDGHLALRSDDVIRARIRGI